MAMAQSRHRKQTQLHHSFSSRIGRHNGRAKGDSCTAPKIWTRHTGLDRLRASVYNKSSQIATNLGRTTTAKSRRNFAARIVPTNNTSRISHCKFKPTLSRSTGLATGSLGSQNAWFRSNRLKKFISSCGTKNSAPHPFFVHHALCWINSQNGAPTLFIVGLIANAIQATISGVVVYRDANVPRLSHSWWTNRTVGNSLGPTCPRRCWQILKT